MVPGCPETLQQASKRPGFTRLVWTETLKNEAFEGTKVVYSEGLGVQQLHVRHYGAFSA